MTAFAEAITGQPLTLTRGQVPVPAGADSPSAARRVATNEAFARTMGSGDHGDSPLAMIATAAPGVPGSPMLRNPPTANAPIAVGTARSAPRAIAAAPGAAASPPLATVTPVTPVAPPVAATVDVSTHDAPRPPGRSARVIAAIVLAGAAAAAAMYLVMRDHGPARPEQQERRPGDRVATVIPTDPKATDPKATDPKATDPKATDPKATDPKATDPKATDPKATDPKAVGQKPSDPGAAHLPGRPGPSAGRKDHGVVARPPVHDGPPAVPSGEEDDDAREKLSQANAALERRDYDAAERLATAVINSSAGPRQRAAARLVHGTVQCVARNDQEAAQIDLRNLVGFRALRTKLLSVCRNHGILGQ
ncbi:MAG TPA: hypothetical protein VGD37_34405 [Kofleriaceae bacterium]